MKKLACRAVLLLLVAVCSPPASATDVIRIGVLKFGTVNWELDTLKRHGLDARYGLDVEMVPFAGEDATNVALRAGAVDMIVSDWLDVSRARTAGDDLVFVPYSSSVGAVMVPDRSGIRTLADLAGRKIGVVGGPLDKSWLLIQGLARREAGIDLASANDIVYGAPPLLAEKALQGELDAVLTYWHYAARLEAEGFRRLVSAEDAMRALGASGQVSALGYVFSEAWAGGHSRAVANFVRASRDAKALLDHSDAEWDRLHADGVIRDEGRALAVLRQRYREGIPDRAAADDEADAGRLFAVLAELGGERLVGPSPVMAPGTYWSGLTDDH
ncbi:NitT/TauT family transport system substrate-binding protein [Hoeflea marina]|uniref:NitT/TauT family transport system substrate-binding protein n=2 Tax=Hoeflea marina TaxID=274592 RepID=A0A317PL95_9HYPH|nr:NitT/TauT family transport system substrate-binding protein [Hoeflea marina]